jgi:hypothetical protein
MKKVAVIVGSESDTEQMEKGIEVLKQFDIPYDFKVLSAHRDPDALHDYIKSLDVKMFSVIIAGAGVCSGSDIAPCCWCANDRRRFEWSGRFTFDRTDAERNPCRMHGNRIKRSGKRSHICCEDHVLK